MFQSKTELLCGFYHYFVEIEMEGFPWPEMCFLQSFHDMRQSVKTLPELFTVQMYLLSRNLRLYESGNTEKAELEQKLSCGF